MVTPGWEQFVSLSQPNYVAYMVEVVLNEDQPAYLGYSLAAKRMLETFNHIYEVFGEEAAEKFTYKHLLPKMKWVFHRFGIDPHPKMDFEEDKRR